MKYIDNFVRTTLNNKIFGEIGSINPTRISAAYSLYSMRNEVRTIVNDEVSDAIIYESGGGFRSRGRKI